MSNLSQFRPNGFPVGMMTFLPEKGDMPRFGDGSQLLRSGSAVATTNYPLAASLDALKVTGITCSLAASAQFTGWATDGAGTWVIAYGDATNVQRSNDNGATWATVAHNNTNPVTDVAYIGSSSFVTVGNGTAAITTSKSTNNGSSFSAGGSATTTSTTANTARIVWDGTTIVMAASATNVAQAATSTNGTSLTARSLSQVVTNPRIAVLVSLGASRWLIVGSSTAWSQSSAADGSAWTSRTGPAGVTGVAAGNGFFMAAPNNSRNLYRSSDGSTYTTLTVPAEDAGYPAGGRLSGQIVFNGTYFMTGVETFASGTSPTAFYYTSNGGSFTQRWLINGAGLSGSASYGMIGASGTNFIYLPASGASAVGCYSTTFPNGDWVGSSITTFAYTTVGGISSAIGYYRIA